MWSKLESFILEKMSKTRLPGLSIAIVSGNEIIYANGFGFRDIEYGLPATPRTIYGIGSVTKSFTALSIMQLVEKGVLSLEDPIEKFIPLEIRPFGEEIRIWHLLTHSSGIPALAYAEAFISSIVGDYATWVPIASHKDVLPFMSDAEDWVISKPGKEFYYLNEGYVILGHIIEKVSGIRYEDYVKRNILKPLKMERSFFSREELEKDIDKATPYVIDREGKWIKSTYPFGITSDGGLLSNTLDLANYIVMYLNRGRFNSVELVSSKTLEEMEKPRIIYKYSYFPSEGYALGWSVIPNFLGYKLIHHSGSVLVSTAYVGYLPEKKLGVVILANASGYPLSFIGMYALALALGRDPDKDVEPLRHDRLLDELCGIYETYKSTMRIYVERRGGVLYLVMKGKYRVSEIPLIPERLGEDEALFFTSRLGLKVPVKFRKRDNYVELVYDRYLLRRKV